MTPRHGRDDRDQVCDMCLAGAWELVHTIKAGEGSSPTGSPSLLLGNFPSCFLGTSYLQKRGREPLKGFQMGGPRLRLSPGRHEVCESEHAF